MNVKSLLLFTLLHTISFFAKGQYDKRDSILSYIESIRNTPLDTAHISRLRIQGYDLIEKDSLLSNQLLNEALAKSLIVKEANTITNCYRLLGVWHSYFDNKDKALEYYRLSLQSAMGNRNQYLIAGANFNMGNIKYWKGEYDSCIHFYIRAAEIFENPKILEDKTVTERQLDLRKSDLYSNLSVVFNTLRNLSKADEYIDKAIAITKKYTSPIAASTLARYMQNKADNYFENGETEKALRIRLNFLPQMENGESAKTFLQGAYQNIAQEYFSLKKIDSSRFFGLKSMRLATTLKVQSGIANANWQLARIALEEKQYQEADKYMEAARDYYLTTSDDPAEQRNYYEVMQELKFAEGRYKEAYLDFKKFNAINDSLLTSEKAKEFSEREIRYQTEKKDAQLKLQQVTIRQKSILNYILIVGAIGLFIILLLSYRTYYHKQKLQKQQISKLETERQLMATEAVLKGEEKERTRLAKDLHDGLGGMLSGIKYSFQTMKGNLIMTPDNAQAFERSMDMLDSSIKEMRRVAHNMMPEALVKFGLDTALKDYCNDINQIGVININYQSIGLNGSAIEQTTAIAIYRIVQELLNNAIKHAVAKNIITQVSKTQGSISITVEDDGKGFDTTILEHNKPRQDDEAARGIGWATIQNRVDLLKGKMDVRSEAGKGTSVFIELQA